MLDRIDAFTEAVSANDFCIGERAVRVDVTVALLALPFAPFDETFTFEVEAAEDVDPRASAPWVAWKRVTVVFNGADETCLPPFAPIPAPATTVASPLPFIGNVSDSPRAR